MTTSAVDPSAAARRIAGVAALLALLAVAAGAFGAHALETRLDARGLEVYEIAVRYQMYHALGMFAVAACKARGVRGASLAAWLMLGGVVVFSGSLYALAATGVKALGAVTPIGGAALLAAWAILAINLLRRDDSAMLAE